MKTILLTLMMALLLATGCAHNAHRTAEAQAYYDAQRALVEQRAPLFEMRAQPGEAIVLQGVERLVVHDPREAHIQSLPAQRSQAMELAGDLLRIGGQVFGLKVVADGLVDLADRVGHNAGDHSTTTIRDSYNQRGHTIDGDVSGPGAGIGNRFRIGDGSVVGDGSAVDNAVGDRAGRDLIGRDRVNNRGGRYNSPGPFDESGDCRGGADCSTPPTDGDD